eukprot:15188237-Heterocapsa_arctica.AAC.1
MKPLGKKRTQGSEGSTWTRRSWSSTRGMHQRRKWGRPRRRLHGWQPLTEPAQPTRGRWSERRRGRKRGAGRGRRRS